MEIKNILKNLRNKRNKKDENYDSKSQKRVLEIIEYEDKSYLMKGYAWELPLKEDEIQDAFEAWLDGSLENGKELDSKSQKRALEIIEYEDKSYLMKGYAWELPLKEDEIQDAFEAWLDGSLENGKELDIENI